MKKKYNKQKSFGYDANGKRIIKWFHSDSKQDLERQIEKYRLQLELTPNASTIRFKDYAEKWRTTYKGNRSKATQDMYRYALRHTEPIDELQLTKITQTKCQECIQTVWDRPTMAKNVANTLRQIFGAAVQDGMLVRNPALQLELPKRPKSRFYLLDDKILDAITKTEFCYEDSVLVTILRTFGLRPGEALALNTQDFDFTNMILHITKSLELSNDNKSRIKSTKTGVSRDIPIPNSLVPLLRDYFGHISGFYLFTDKDNNFISKSQYRVISKRITRSINKTLGGDDKINMVPGFTLYAFRHRRASELFYLTQNGTISILQAAQLMGHSVQVFLNTDSHINENKENLHLIYDESVTKSVTVTNL